MNRLTLAAARYHISIGNLSLARRLITKYWLTKHWDAKQASTLADWIHG